MGKKEYILLDYKEALEIVLSMARAWQDTEEAEGLTTREQAEAIECLETLKDNIEIWG
jgi:hypothetical protein